MPFTLRLRKVEACDAACAWTVFRCLFWVCNLLCRCKQDELEAGCCGTVLTVPVLKLFPAVQVRASLWRRTDVPLVRSGSLFMWHVSLVLSRLSPSLTLQLVILWPFVA